MRTYEITIKPISGFGTLIKGDTLFGHICWQAIYDSSLFDKSLGDLLSDYNKNPFLVISSAFPKIGDLYALKRPDMPLDKLFNFSSLNKKDILAKRKELKEKRLMLVGEKSPLSDLKNALYLNDDELFCKILAQELSPSYRKKNKKSVTVSFSQPHNTINRLTGTTGEGQFTPYTTEQTVFSTSIELAIFAGIRGDITIEQLIKALKIVGSTGFGKDASIGLGKFDVKDYKELDFKSLGSNNPNATYVLSPVVLSENNYKKIYFSPFVRFGRHGDILAKSKNPFKNPVIMADEGAVLIPNNFDFSKPYIGKAINGISKVEPKAVTQGYSLYIPVKVEEIDE